MDSLPRPQLFALIEQMSATQRNLTHGLQMLASSEYRSPDLDVVLQSLARGSETLVKLTRILAHLHAHGTLPPERRGHRVDLFEPEVRRSVSEAAEDVIATWGWLRMLAEFVAADPVIGELLAILGRYGEGERYHHLDRAHGKIAPEQLNPVTPEDEARARVAPERAWDELVVRTALALDLSLLDADTTSKVRRHLVLSFGSWWEFYAAIWVRALGDLGRQCASSIRPPIELRPSADSLNVRLTLPA
ncbi:hypothetical protein HDA40_005476 [Hamadaea flava]|uniref:Uncharacterized protein n=1 Tax=Hamadaea flava TaxID=1742688 RepID=A0ABV8LZC7_9ACTN|nr:hypothetical protein [Hamadaea flava]MCP2326969.1 hypothetical protein [Hamadaea flava]